MFKAESFTNEFGTVNPGDKVCFTTLSYKRVSMRIGVYQGFSETNTPTRSGKVYTSRRCRVLTENAYDKTPQMVSLQLNRICGVK